MINLLILLYAYFVSFTDKPEKTVPALSERAVEQRAKWNIPTDELDYPVSAMYLDSLRKAGISIYHTSRWFNGATVEMDELQAGKVAEWTFVKAVEMTRDDSQSSWWLPKKISRLKELEAQPADNTTDNQLKLYNLLPLHEAGFEGQGILMTICDGGFYHADSISCFRQDELELGHFDFTDDTVGFYGITGTHGTECLSTISGILDGFYGAATKAQYYLMRAEENDTESPKEMDNLVAALEKADSLGTNVFSVSLGYAMFDNNSWTLPKSALDGRTTRVSLAATIAARKGMLVCVAAGNEGNSSWHTISAPADADSILTVGAVNANGTIGRFSSYGPSADGRIKPEVCAVGVATALISPTERLTNGDGTSFATPLIAGLAASLWSALPDENAMQIRERIIRSANRYQTPDTKQYGYGIPDAWMAYQGQTQDLKDIGNQEDRQPQKIMDGGNIYILRHGHIYNLAGQRIR